MKAEALQAPEVVARLLGADQAVHAAITAAWHEQPPHNVVTLARGSSDHAAGYLAYLTMVWLHRPVTSLPMSVMTVHGSTLHAQGLWSVAVSQSGRSPDLVEPTCSLRQRGARTLAIVNDTESPLARAAEWVLPLHAGPELSIAATKSFIAQLVVGARLVSGFSGDAVLAHALQSLPEVLSRAATLDWSPAMEILQRAHNLFVVGRGHGLPVAMEAALKLKETCGLHAEALSAAELQHGPKALLDSDFVVLVLAPRGAAQAGLLQAAQGFRDHGAQVLVASPEPCTAPGITSLPLVCSAHADLDPISTVQTFYAFVEALARARGLDPDAPRHLSKVTLTR